MSVCAEISLWPGSHHDAQTRHEIEVLDLSQRSSRAFERALILRALRKRQRYKYVQPTINAEGIGWIIRSPCCSRRVDPEGGVIDIARIEPESMHSWQLFAKVHEHQRWRQVLNAVSLQAVVNRLREDPLHEFWI